MTDVVILGIGIHPFGRFDKSYQQLGAEAAIAALVFAALRQLAVEADAVERTTLPTPCARTDKDELVYRVHVVRLDRGDAARGAFRYLPRPEHRRSLLAVAAAERR